MKIKTSIATALAFALLTVNTSAVEVKNLVQKNSEVRAQTSANLQLSAALFARLRARFATEASTEEEAYTSIQQALLDVSDAQECVESELASQWGIYSTLKCFAPLEEIEVVPISEPNLNVDFTSGHVDAP
jgi:hypothetical protein